MPFLPVMVVDISCVVHWFRAIGLTRKQDHAKQKPTQLDSISFGSTAVITHVPKTCLQTEQHKKKNLGTAISQEGLLSAECDGIKH